MHTHQIPPGCSLHDATPAPVWRLPAAWACRHTHATSHDTHSHIACMHTRHRRPVRAYYMSKKARARARCTCAGPRCSSSGRLTSSCGPLDGRLAPTLAPTARRRRHAALSAARGPMAAAAAAAAAELLGSAPTMAAAADKEPVRVERETPIPPHPAPGVGRSGQWQTPGRPRAASGAARDARWRRADVGGWWRSRADAVEDDPGRLSKLKNRQSCARVGRPRRGSDWQ